MNSVETMDIWNRPLPKQLLEALLVTARSEDLAGFLRDVMTEKEIIEIAARLEAARLLSDGVSYALVQEKTKLSSRTIARISLWLKQGNGGYSSALTNHLHMSPDRAD